MAKPNLAGDGKTRRPSAVNNLKTTRGMYRWLKRNA